jgi:hypothetical protein
MARRERPWDPEAVADDLRRDEGMAQSYQDQHRRDENRRDSVDMSAAEELVAFMLKNDAALRSRETFLEKLAEMRSNAASLADYWQGVSNTRTFPGKVRDYINRLIRRYS